MGRILTHRITAAAALALLVAGCTVHEQKTPSLSGPSELATSISIAITPDVINQDGASQALVTITARDANGSPLRNLPLRVEISVNNVITDFGTLSARNVVTDNNGRATVTYTAPAAPAVSVDTFTTVQIMVTPTGSDYGNETIRYANLRLTPPGIVISPSDLNAQFTVSPSSPSTDTPAVFDATGSIAANAGTTIVSYVWDFGDGDSASGRQVSHQYGSPGNYVVTLTIKDATNKSGTAKQNITVTLPSTGLSAAFVYSPNPSQLNQPIHFDATTSTVTPPHRIVSYTWNFGEGTVITTGSPRIDFTYQLPRTYVVVLTVTDDTGQTKTTTTPITPQ